MKDILYMNDGQVIGFGKEGIVELAIEKATDNLANGRALVVLSTNEVNGYNGSTIWLDEHMISEMILYLENVLYGFRQKTEKKLEGSEEHKLPF